MSRRRVVKGLNSNSRDKSGRLKWHAWNRDGGPGCSVDGGPGVDYCAKCAQGREDDVEYGILRELDKYAGAGR